ncbi:MAG: hypothetical protein WBK88_07005 [Methanothrix sp.]
MVGEDALFDAAGGDFNLILIAVLVFSLIGAFIWALKIIIAQNQRFQDQILGEMREVVGALKEYKCDMERVFSIHDAQAKEIKTTTERIENTLKSRPCVRDDRR